MLDISREAVINRRLPNQINFHTINLCAPGILRYQIETNGPNRSNMRNLLVAILPVKSLKIYLKLIVEETIFCANGVSRQSLRLCSIRRLRGEESARLKSGRDVRIKQRRRSRINFQTSFPRNAIIIYPADQRNICNRKSDAQRGVLETALAAHAFLLMGIPQTACQAERRRRCICLLSKGRQALCL